MFTAIILTRAEDKSTQAAVAEADETDLPEGDVTVAVSHSTLNYKDGLAITGKGPVVRSWPMIPGIDFAGTVADSSHAAFKPGDRVVLNGWGLGETRWGGLGAKARVPGDWLVPLPDAFSPAQAMAIGTAGYTAALSVLELERQGATPDKGPVLVTGASGGVGGVAIALLASKGFEVVALTGRTSEEAYLKGLGASAIMDRAEYAGPAKPLGKERWAAAIDTVGTHTLANVLSQMKMYSPVASCGLAGGMDLPSSVAPFILRGVKLCGIDSVYMPKPERVAAYALLAAHLDPARLEAMTETVGLADAIPAAERLMAGQVRGRVVVDVTR
ncbi:oxidoreductase [Roseospira marina]|uniref:Oxidoreductase n=1 Tax=Roseospira marina TaxID=140057 RepID=A0A5M6I944_9PROT|nr:MDR family oxidoreductase [Roseospira marina]KAA5604780.1 oxidoreductase [Roseospira marina]MBB4313464.1 acrylyl-CoA reductase (NADPH) [Roseospira marina]MBB5086626.1 acrylyl-CoA reductase (NADPH) [Roseospira marina]